MLNPENIQDIQIGIRISSYLAVGPDFASLAAACQQHGFYAGVLRLELQHAEVGQFGYDLAHRRQALRRQRLELLREVWVIEEELRNHRPFQEWFD